MGYQFKYANMTKGRITTAIESDATPFMAEIGPLLLGAYEMYENNKSRTSSPRLRT